jgi:glycerol-3-phosphate acyltransferase PlsY
MIAARVLSVLLGYVFGLFQTGYIYGRSKGIDIRKQGSGNPGTTNSLRVLGIKAGIITFLGDLFKAILAVVVAWLIFKDRYPDSVRLLELYAGFGAVLGHNFPFYLGFKGGKGIASTAGVILSVYPLAAIGCLIVFSVCLAISRYVSLSSILMVLTFMVTALVANNLGYLGVASERMLEFDILVICFTAMAIWRHRANIVRLIHGNENKLSIGKSK